MKVFISWSGTKSRDVAIALREWLPLVINSIEPFVSSKDIYAGTRWQAEIASQLESTNFGMVCVTRENQAAPWLNFEAGALAKAVDASRVVPLAIDLKPSDVTLPLAQFQAQPATKDGMTAVMESMNAACDQPLDAALLERATDKWWPDLEAQLKKIEEKTARGTKGAPDRVSRSDRELIEETLNTVRDLARNIAREPIRESEEEEELSSGDPLLVELNEMLTEWDPTAQAIPFAGKRRVGVMVPTELPPPLEHAVLTRAGREAVPIEVMLRPRELLARQAKRRNERAERAKKARGE